MHKVVVVALPPVTTFDLSISEAVFSNVLVDGRPGYQVRICTPEAGVITSTGVLQVLVRDGLEADDRR
jgi:hypothetical protein